MEVKELTSFGADGFDEGLGDTFEGCDFLNGVAGDSFAGHAENDAAFFVLGDIKRSCLPHGEHG